MTKETKITTYYLEMRNPSELRPARLDDPAIEARQARIPSPELHRFLYTAVGGDWYWVDRLAWTYDRWLEYIDRPNFETWVCFQAGTPCGYFTLEAQAGGNVEIHNFGLLPRFIGKGLGGHFLTLAVERAWAMGASRVWVHTCTHDHPHALANYQARGFRLFKEMVSFKTLPDQPPGPWPGACRPA
jgi:GNAT superfamily N-acetyltransferase